MGGGGYYEKTKLLLRTQFVIVYDLYPTYTGNGNRSICTTLYLLTGFLIEFLYKTERLRATVYKL